MQQPPREQSPQQQQQPEPPQPQQQQQQADASQAPAAATPDSPQADTAAAPPQQAGGCRFSDHVSLEQLRQQLEVFAAERHWQQFHTPRNLLLALVGEVGELSEIFQWRHEVAPGLPGFTDAERHHVGQELSDVLLYTLRLADVCGIDLAAAAQDKLAHNARKYPVELSRNSSAKYTAYTAGGTSGVEPVAAKRGA